MGNSLVYALDILVHGVDVADKRMEIRKAVKAHPKCPYTGERLTHRNTVVVEVCYPGQPAGVSVMHYTEWTNYRDHTLRYAMREGQRVFIHDGRTLFQGRRRWNKKS